MTKKFKISAAEMLCLISGFLIEGVSYGATTLKVSRNLRYAEVFKYDLHKSATQNIADLAAICGFGENLKNAAESYQKAVIKLPWYASTAATAKKIIKQFNLPDIVIDCAVPQEDYAPQRQHLVCCA